MQKIVTYLDWGLYIGLGGMLWSIFVYIWIVRQPKGNNRMISIARMIEAGAMTFLKREYSALIFFLMFVTAILGQYLGRDTAFAYLNGALSSMFCIFVGLKIATKSNVRTTEAAASKGSRRALSVAFLGASVMGMTVASVGLLGILLYFQYLTSSTTIEALNSFAMGVSSIALFTRVGGGIFTKAADVGADMVGKIEVGIPEDDPRNPASIVDNVGDNIGDAAGAGSDIFESYVSSIVATMFIGSTFVQKSTEAMMLPIFMAMIGVVSSLLAIIIMNVIRGKNPQFALRFSLIFGLGILLWGAYRTCKLLSFNEIFPYANGPFYAILVGAILGVLIGISSEYYTSHRYLPARKLALASKAGAATNIITGISVGMYSTIPSMFLLCTGLFLAQKFAGLYGIGLAAVGVMATTGINLTIEAYGPISDNASGIAELSKLDPEVRKITDELDFISQNTGAMSRGFSIASATLTSLAIFSAFATSVGLTTINLIDSNTITGLFIGATLPFFVGARTMNAVGDTAQKIVSEVRRQFREIAGLMEGQAAPEASRCVEIATQSSLKHMMMPGLVTFAMPLAVGFGLGKQALGGALIGAITTGTLLALFMGHAGGAWENAKKSIEQGKILGEQKGSEAYKASVIGDTIGDPFKDTSGPAMNILIKLTAIVALVVAPLL